MKAFDPIGWKHKKELDITFLNNTSVPYLNELEIIPESPSQPVGISNYTFANAFYSHSIFLIDLRTGYVVKEWDFKFLSDH